MASIIENLYVGDGTTVLYSFTFPYIEEGDIKVSLDDVITTEYSLANATTVEFVAAPANGVAIRIYRDTSVANPKAVFYPGSAIRAQDLNDNFEQNLFVIQEADFNNTQSAADSAAALATAQAADTKADQANVQSAAAEASATQAQLDATQAAADAATAQADATQAATDAASAQIAADQANTAVQAAAIFAPVANVAAIPGSPADQDRVSVLDSTGIGSFTPLTGLPVGPTYDSGVYVNLVYQNTGATWEFVVYGPNDPDSRYLFDTADSVSTSNITNNAVTTDKIVNAAVTTDKLGTDSVTTAKVIDAAVTPAKLDRAYVEKAGDTMTGELIVPSLSGPSGNLPIQRASVADSQVQSFTFQDTAANNWYPFNPIPTWCNHIRYDISVILSVNGTSDGGFYLRWGSAAGQLLQGQVSASGPNASTLQNGPGSIYYADPLLLAATAVSVIYYDYTMDFYIYNRGLLGGPEFYCYGIGSGAQTATSPIQANISNARMSVQQIIPQAPNTIMPDRMGVLIFGGSTATGQNRAQVKQTFLTDGPTGSLAELGPTPTPI